MHSNTTKSRARRIVNGHTWESQGHGRWTATIAGRKVQADACYRRRTQAGWSLSVDDKYLDQGPSLQWAMVRASERVK